MPRTVNGFTLQTISEKAASIRGDFEASFPGEGAYIRGAIWYVVSGLWAGALYVAETMRAKLAREMFASTASEAYLAYHAAEYLTPRNPATACVATVQFTWTAGGQDIPAATTLTADDGTVYVTDALIADPWPVVTASGTATCQTAGAAASVVVAATLTLAAPIAGITSEGSATAAVAGTDEEELEAWRVRILDAKRTIPDGGTLADFEAWALDVDGVLRAWPYKAAEGSAACVVDPAAKAAAVQTAVDSVRPISGMFTAIAVVEDNVPMTVAGYIDGSKTAAEVRTAILAAVNSLYQRDGTPGGGIVRNSDIRAAIASAVGLSYYTMSSYNGVAGGLADYTCAASTVPIVVTGDVTWGGDL